ncbi:hypothetical protein [Rhodococcoides fascians]|uniref:hypothetical protein n=1 Tax=Rhodococcoides fascians TaxID=1828 RepID=UPI00366B2575
MSESHESSLFEALGVPRDSLIEPPPDQVWDDAMAYALDPNSPDVGDDLIPATDEGIDDTVGDSAATDENEVNGDGHDLGDVHAHLDLRHLIDDDDPDVTSDDATDDDDVGF